MQHAMDQLHREVYIRRIQLSAETFLLEADERGKESQRYVRKIH